MSIVSYFTSAKATLLLSVKSKHPLSIMQILIFNSNFQYDDDVDIACVRRPDELVTLLCAFAY